MTAHTHTPRMDLSRLAPDVYQAMLALDQAASKGFDPTIAELVRIRASQINHCALCIHMHSNDARAAGETEERVLLLNAWAEAGVFSEREQAALALTEAVTVLTDGFVPDEVYERAAAHFSEEELARLISLIFTINAWNRIGVTTRQGPRRG
ncbi:carboxymuconolactone decarboxylase family protein [Streptomyces litchfieldiae]|uniref:Carboxymuconolactone decarboxylase family protein n=1 Tax=Streptomyces litchfieldiae TaxID=3075543 RepID=A0ABU2MTG9_9ACTN|nr:carboxymuconolactone decarboxylase family protein [Streptomyces sp. DSM 44938]MDT0344369.1 carboxymuconolactone decarboxylase family protein [Streptomyces sp. DSM 44938]